MLHCFEQVRDAGYGPLLILGSDSPALPPSHLAGWPGRLAEHPAVIGPAEDGGYWAIGCRAPHPRMFAGVEWSSPLTLAQTEAALAACGLAPGRLSEHWDVDTPEDVDRLAAEEHLPPQTRQWLRDNYKPPTNSRNRRA